MSVLCLAADFPANTLVSGSADASIKGRRCNDHENITLTSWAVWSIDTMECRKVMAYESPVCCHSAMSPQLHGVQVTSVAIFDGLLLSGTEDGFVRYARHFKPHLPCCSFWSRLVTLSDFEMLFEQQAHSASVNCVRHVIAGFAPQPSHSIAQRQ